MGEIGCGRASGGRKGVTGKRGGAGCKPLVERGIGGEVGVFIVVIEEGGDKGPIGVRVGGLGFSASYAGAMDESRDRWIGDGRAGRSGVHRRRSSGKGEKRGSLGACSRICRAIQ